MPVIMGFATNEIVAGRMQGLEYSVIALLAAAVLMFACGMLGRSGYLPA